MLFLVVTVFRCLILHRLLLRILAHLWIRMPQLLGLRTVTTSPSRRVHLQTSHRLPPQLALRCLLVTTIETTSPILSGIMQCCCSVIILALVSFLRLDRLAPLVTVS